MVIPKWKTLSGDTIIADYPCKKVVTTFRGSPWVVWICSRRSMCKPARNLSADLVGSVQILQNHQPVKVLRGVSSSGQTALKSS